MALKPEIPTHGNQCNLYRSVAGKSWENSGPGICAYFSEHPLNGGPYDVSCNPQDQRDFIDFRTGGETPEGKRGHHYKSGSKNERLAPCRCPHVTMHAGDNRRIDPQPTQ